MLEEIELIKQLIKTYRVKKYLKKVTKRHPEIENYGLNCDAQLWVEFNKELRVREIAKEERDILRNMFMFNGENVEFENGDFIEDEEREYALAKLSVLIEKNQVDRLTFLKVKKRG